MRRPNLNAFVLALLLAVWGSNQASAGSIVRWFYDNITGTSISNLTTNPIFPDQPGGSETLAEYFEGTPNSLDNYGSWIRGYIEAPQTGNYTFWIESDDPGQLWLSSDTTQAHTNLIAYVSDGLYTSARQWDKYTSQQSAPIALVKGQKYYVEVFQKDGTGGDHVAVGWQLPDNTLERPIPGYRLETWFPSSTAVNIAMQPASASVNEGDKVVFFVNVDAPTPPTFQWYKNNVRLQDEILSALVIDKAKLADNNAVFYVKVNGTIPSDPATLAVAQDTIMPTLVTLDTMGYDTLIQLVFSEPVTPPSATNPASYSVSGGVTVNSVFMVDSKTFRLFTSKRDNSSAYTLTINGVSDFAGTPNIMVNVTKQFGAVRGSILDRIYTGLSTSDNAISTGLRAVAKFPNSPDVITNLPAFEGPSSYAEGYGQYIQGWLVPDVTGIYSFAVAADDTAQVYLSPDDSAANAVQILNETAWAGPRLYTKTGVGTLQTASTYSLVASRKYYIELLHKEGNGGDNLALAWQLGGGTIPDNTEPIPGANLIPYIPPTTPLAITTQPQSQTVLMYRSVTFTIVNSGLPNYSSLQWYRDGNPISGANGLSYTITSVSTNDNGAVFYAKMTNLVYAATSSNAVLTVNMDFTPPGLASVCSVDGTTVGLVFNEAVDPATATNRANYSVTGSSVSSVTIAGNNRVQLTLAGKAANPFTVTVSNVKDLAENVIPAGTQIQGKVLSLTFENIANPLQGQESISTPGYVQIVGAGADIWGTADQFVYAYANMTGDFDYRLDVKSMTNPNVWAKCGIMVRASTDPGSQYILNAATPQAGNNEYATQWRPVAAAAAVGYGTYPVAQYPDSWLRLKRTGNTFYSYWSADGTNWTLYYTLNTATDTGWATGPMPQTTLLGIATTSHSATANVTVLVNDYGMLPQLPVAISNQPPASISRSVNTPLTISVVATGDPIRYQWVKDGVDIAGANSSTLSIPLVQQSDAGTYTVRVFNDTSSVNSSGCVVTISTDNTPPTVLQVAGSRSFNTVTVAFSEPMDQSTVENTANYSFSGGLTILGAVRQANMSNVVLTTSQQTSGTSYTLTFNNVTDLSGNKIAASTKNNFTGFVFAMGAAVEEIYNNTGSTAGTVDGLLTAPNFIAGTPSTSTLINSMNIWSQGGTVINGVTVITSYYGGRYCGWFVPSVSGSYRFAIASDDGGALWLSTNDQPVDKNSVNPIATVSTDGTTSTTAYTAQATWTTYASQISGSIQLQAGQKYFLEALWENGGGGNGCSVGWIPPGSSSTSVLPIANMGAYVNPDLATITISQQPTNITVLQSRTATFTIVATGVSELGSTVGYQWQKNGTDITGANSATYTTGPTTMADNNAVFTCKVSLPTKSVTSSSSTLTVTPDTTPPTVTAVFGTQGAAYVAFDELLDSTSASIAANYVVAGGTVTGAKVLGDGKTVALTVSGVTGTTVSVTTSGVKDYALNTVATATKSGPLTTLIDTDVGTRNTNNLALFSDPVMPGFASVLNQTDFDILAGGTDIWNAQDGINFLYKQVTGDFDLKVQVASLQMINTWSKAGLMVRQDLEGTSRMMAVLVTPQATNAAGATVGGQGIFQVAHRDSKGAAAAEVVANLRPALAADPNNWVRLQRVGNVFYAYYGNDGVKWTPFVTNAPLIAYSATLYVGLGVTSHDNAANRTTVAQFRNFGDATAAVVVQPKLAISASASTVTITWPLAQGAGFSLQSASSLVSPIQWSPVNATDSPNTSNHVVTVPITGTQQYFEMKK